MSLLSRALKYTSIKVTVCNFVKFTSSIKVNKSRYKQCWITLHFSTRWNLLKKVFRKNKYWYLHLRRAYSNRQNLLKKNWEKIILTQSIEKSFLTDLLNTNYIMYQDLLSLKQRYRRCLSRIFLMFFTKTHKSDVSS